MSIFKTIDDSGAYSVHKCDNIEQSKQVHLLHYGLLYVNFKKILELDSSNEVCNEKDCEILIHDMRLEGFGNL